VKIAVIGLGSMGRRRLRILRRNFPQHELIGVDTSESRRLELEKGFAIKTFADASPLSGEVDAVFICSSPQSHAEIFKDLDLDALHSFSELDLLDEGYERLLAAEAAGTKRHFLSSTPLYDREVREISRFVSNAGKIAYRFHVGQYLPDWHPWERYSDFFIGAKRTNGCREIMAIEFPWLLKAFGPLVDVSVDKLSLSGLKIDYPDTIVMTLRHQHGTTGQFIVDVVSRVAKHELEIFGEDISLNWNGRPNSIVLWKGDGAGERQVRMYDEVEHQEGYAETIIEDPYVEEVTAFFEGIDNPDRPYIHTYADSWAMLKLLDHIERVQ
jgi:predicted dehydrogenase